MRGFSEFPRFEIVALVIGSHRHKVECHVGEKKRGRRDKRR
jgi:hypothetical protein